MSATTAQNTRYGIGKSVPLPYEHAVERTRAALQQEGFGALTEIDVQATLKKKLDFQAEPDIGLLLPCNVIVYEEDAVRSRVAVLDPLVQLGITGSRWPPKRGRGSNAR